jgi:hypothetical protein
MAVDHWGRYDQRELSRRLIKVANLITSKGVFTVMRICTHVDLARMRRHAKNFICESIVKRDKRMLDAGHCAGCYPGAGHPHAGACLQFQWPF